MHVLFWSLLVHVTHGLGLTCELVGMQSLRPHPSLLNLRSDEIGHTQGGMAID